MTPQECLQDELEYLMELKSFFEKIKFEVMIFNVEKRILLVQSKLNHLQPLSETIY